MKIADSCRGIVELLLSASGEPFETIWFYCHMAGGGPAISCYIQPKENPKTVRNHLAVIERSLELRNLIMTKWDEDAHGDKKRWSTMTIVLKGSGDQTDEYTFENLNRVNLFKMTDDWSKSHLSGLKFIPDKR
jgi:hypothetical protein